MVTKDSSGMITAANELRCYTTEWFWTRILFLWAH